MQAHIKTKQSIQKSRLFLILFALLFLTAVFVDLYQSSKSTAGLNIYKGKVTFKGVAEAFKLDYTPPEKAILD